MKRVHICSLLLAGLSALFIPAFNAFAAESCGLSMKILDIEGKGAEGAKLFLYDTPNVRRPADFISPASGQDGLVRIDLPVGKYWAVARWKNDGKYGPLMPGDKHSGEPVEFEIEKDRQAEAELLVADIREMARKNRTSAEAVKLRGRVLDDQGNPAANAYVFARSTRNAEQLPDYLSAWTDEDGKYELHVPSAGRFYLGAATKFPPESTRAAYREIVSSGDKIDIAIDISLIVR